MKVDLWTGIVLFFIFGVKDSREAFFQNDFDLFPELPLGVPKSENPVCREHSELFVDNLKNFTLWAHEMWDATAKASTGVLRGNVFQMGHFEQCLTSKAPFETLYCMATVTVHIPHLENPNRDMLAIDFDPGDSVLDRLYVSGSDFLKIRKQYSILNHTVKDVFLTPYYDMSNLQSGTNVRGPITLADKIFLTQRYNDKTQQPRDTINLGWCIPASCTFQDLESSLNEYLNNVDTPLNKKNVTYTARIKEEFCQRATEKQQYNSADYSFGLLTLILVVLVLLSTTYDYHVNKKNPEEKATKKSLTQKMILSFSARANFTEMAQAETTNQDLNILYGLRTIAILVIIMDHRFGTFTSSALINFDYVEQQFRAPFASVVFHGDLFVDTFFLLSGLLVAYGLLTQFDKRMVNPGFIVFLRYVRLTPVYAFVIFYYATVFDYTGNGPLWKVIAGADSMDCKNNWWANLLYINNYVNAEHMCMTHAWYLPCDFHYFIIAIGICLLIKKEKKIGLSALLTATIISMIIPFILTVVYQRPGMLMFYPDFLTGPKTHTDFLLTYSKSHARATPYFIGMFAGYLYYKLKGKNNHVCKTKTAIIFLASILSIAASFLTGKVFWDPYHPYDAYEAAAYSAFHRALWSLGSIGLMYIASYGHASFISKILTWSPWIPLSKLQYGAYLIHMQFQLRSAAKFMNPRYITYFELVFLSLLFSEIPISFCNSTYLVPLLMPTFTRKAKISQSCSDIVLAFIAALCLYLMIEAPFRKIFKELLMPKREPKESKPNAEETQVNNTNASNMENGPRNGNNNVVHNNNISVEDSRL